MSSDPKTTDNKADRIRALNDQFRRTFCGGSICITRSVSERCDVNSVLAAVQAFDNFSESGDPYHEHDFGALEIPGGTEPGAEAATLFFKIDYYSNDMQQGSPDASDPNVTQRILTLMLAEDY